MAEAATTKCRVPDVVLDVLKELGIESILGLPGTNEIPVIDGCAIKPGY